GIGGVAEAVDDATRFDRAVVARRLAVVGGLVLAGIGLALVIADHVVAHVGDDRRVVVGDQRRRDGHRRLLRPADVARTDGHGGREGGPLEDVELDRAVAGVLVGAGVDLPAADSGRGGRRVEDAAGLAAAVVGVAVTDLDVARAIEVGVDALGRAR